MALNRCSDFLPGNLILTIMVQITWAHHRKAFLHANYAIKPRVAVMYWGVPTKQKMDSGG